MASPAPTAVSAVLRIPLTQLQPGPNPRGRLGDVDELALSLKTIGQHEPILVTDLGDGRYQILDGHRRHAASHKAGLPHLDALVRLDHGSAKRLLQQLAMHTQRRAFDPIAEAETLHTLMFEHNLTREQIASAVGKSPAWVRDRIALIHLEPGEKESVRRGQMSLAQAASTLAWRRAQREGQPVPDPKPTPGRPKSHPIKSVVVTGLPSRTVNGNRHCATCRCPGGG